MAGDSTPKHPSTADRASQKSKAELLRELQSLSHLLDEPGADDDIPLLDQPVDDPDLAPEAEGQAQALDDDTLAALQQAYEALASELSDVPAGHPDAPGEPDAEEHPHAVQSHTDGQGPAATAQPAATGDAPAPDARAPAQHQAPADAEPDPQQPGTGQLAKPQPGPTLDDPKPLEGPKLLEGQWSLFEPEPSHAKPDAERHPVPERKAKLARPVLPTKPVGENPFLPAHIRERLRGNQPWTPDSAEPLKPVPPAPAAPAAYPVPQASEPAPADPRRLVDDRLVDDRLVDDRLVDELVAEFLPQIEARLRERLRQLHDDEH